MLYGKFVDASGQLAFQLKFLSAAVGVTEFRYVMNYIHIEQSDKGEGLLVGAATNGRHLHVVDPLSKAATELYGMTPGFWQVLKATRRDNLWLARLDDTMTVDWAYPLWRKIIPNGEPVYKTTFTGFSMKGTKGNFGHLAEFIHAFPEITALDLGYLQALGPDYAWGVEWYGPQKPMKFTECDRLAIIQPMNI